MKFILGYLIIWNVDGNGYQSIEGQKKERNSRYTNPQNKYVIAYTDKEQDNNGGETDFNRLLNKD